MKLINLFETKSSLTGRWVGISAENWPISGEIVTKNIKCCRQTGNRGGHFVFWDIEPEMLGHNPAEVPGHRPVILLLSRLLFNCPGYFQLSWLLFNCPGYFSIYFLIVPATFQLSRLLFNCPSYFSIVPAIFQSTFQLSRLFFNLLFNC